MTHFIIDILNWLCEITQNSLKSAVATVTGSIAGYTPSVMANIDGTKLSPVDVAFQHCVWTLTIIVALFAVINGVQKQIDRYKRRKKQKQDEDDLETLD